MPAAPRWNKKAQKIMFDVLGLPENRVDEEKPKQKKIKKQLTYEEGNWGR